MYSLKATVLGCFTHSSATKRLELLDVDRNLEASIVLPNEDAEKIGVKAIVKITLEVTK